MPGFHPHSRIKYGAGSNPLPPFGRLRTRVDFAGFLCLVYGCKYALAVDH